MLGAICGDVIGSRFERINVKHTQFPLFNEKCCYTDDTTLTMAVADAIMNGKDYAETIKEYGRAHPLAGYGSAFITWLDSEGLEAYNSWGNGGAMRVSPVAWLFDTEEMVLNHAKLTAEVTHNHPEGVKGAQSVALAIFLARTNSSKEEIKQRIESEFGYDLDRTIDGIRETYEFSSKAEDTVPESIIAFLESTDYEDCIRRGISIGGDSDTIAAIAGSIAEAYYGDIPKEILDGTMPILREVPTFMAVLTQFVKTIENKG